MVAFVFSPSRAVPAILKPPPSQEGSKQNPHSPIARGHDKVITTKDGSSIRINSNGRIVSIRNAKGVTIIFGAHGMRTIRSERRNSRDEQITIVNTSRHSGFVDHRYVRDGDFFMHRTYCDNGRSSAVGYGGYSWHGRVYYDYVPANDYDPAFYKWASKPWVAPVVYSWGLSKEAWFGFYNFYFSPFPVYPSATWWLTDDVLRQVLQDAYESQSPEMPGTHARARGFEENSASRRQPADALANRSLTPEIKSAIVDQIRALLEADASAARIRQHAAIASNSPDAKSLPASNPAKGRPAALDPGYRTFIVSSVLSERMPDGSYCTLSPGDVITRIDTAPDANFNVKVLVSASQPGDCDPRLQIEIAVDDLQEMHNRFREQLASGVKSLTEHQGKNGLPAGPAAGGHANPLGQVEPDPDVEAQLKDQLKDADEVEAEALDATRSPSSEK